MKAPVADLISLFVVITELMLGETAHLDSDSSNKLKDNWAKFVQSFLTPNMSCYGTVDHYGTIKVTKMEDALCDIKVERKGESVCLKVQKEESSDCIISIKDSSSTSQASVVNVEITVRSNVLRSCMA